MLKMTEEEQRAYDWAIAQQYSSVSARHARALAQYIQRCKADEASVTDPGDRLPPEPTRMTLDAVGTAGGKASFEVPRK